MRRYNNYAKFIFLICVFNLLQACSEPSRTTTPTPQAADLSLVTSSSCVHPCWQGLELGKATRQEVLDFAKTSPLIAGNYEDGPAATWFWWAGQEHVSARTNIFTYNADVLVEVTLIPNADITLAGVLEANGLPDKFVLFRRHSMRIDGDNSDGYNLRLLYEDLGVEILWEYVDDNLPDQTSRIRVCPASDYLASEILYLTREVMRNESDNYLVGTATNGLNVYAGSDLAKQENGAWDIGCFTIIQY